MRRRTSLLAVVLALVAGCAAASPGGTATPVTPHSPTPTDAGATLAPPDPDEVTAVSLSATDQKLVAEMQDCGVNVWSKQVAGIGILAHATLLPDYVPLTGREPEVASSEPVLAVRYSGTIRVGFRGNPGSATWKDVDGLTCVFVAGFGHMYTTGPWVDSLGRSGTPDLGAHVTKALPAPLP